MRTHHRIEVTLTLLGPILTRGGESPPPGIDAPIARDARGRFMLPFSLIKGKVLDAFRDLKPNDPKIHGWLGKGSHEGSWEPERGRVRFGDFATEQKGKSGDDAVIERIQIDQDTGSVGRGMLAMLEAPFGYGEPVVFQGTIEFIADETEAKAIRTALDEALRWVPAYGAMRTVGFGRTKGVKTELKTVPKSISASPKNGSSLPLQLSLDRPLCLVGKKHSRNHFESLDCIPGAVLKGATARLLLELAGSSNTLVEGDAPPGFPFSTVWRHLAAIRFAEARPMSESALARPVVPPLSTVMAEMTRDDVALWEEPKLLGDRAPVFAPDWKPKQEAAIRTAFGWVDPPREYRTRTAIDAEKGRALDENLFSYGLVLPVKWEKGKLKESFVWETTIGLEGVPVADTAAVRNELAELFAYGLPNIGKTRAVGGVTWLVDRTKPKVTSEPRPKGERIVTLQTDCLMTNPQTHQDPSKTLLDAYAEYWTGISGGSLELVRFFARQSLHGGYLTKRFGKPAEYEPYLLTDRGSVFVLKSLDKSKSDEFLRIWGEVGLPTPGWVSSRDGLPLWQTCPFLPEVGFGEITLDLECHTKNSPEGR